MVRISEAQLLLKEEAHPQCQWRHWLCVGLIDERVELTVSVEALMLLWTIEPWENVTWRRKSQCLRRHLSCREQLMQERNVTWMRKSKHSSNRTWLSRCTTPMISMMIEGKKFTVLCRVDCTYGATHQHRREKEAINTFQWGKVHEQLREWQQLRETKHL